MKPFRAWGIFIVGAISFVAAVLGIYVFAREEIEARVNFKVMQAEEFNELRRFNFEQWSRLSPPPMSSERYARIVGNAESEVRWLSLCVMTLLCRASKLDGLSCYNTIQTYKAAHEIHRRDSRTYATSPGSFWRRLALNCDIAASGRVYLMQGY